jgi:hypothetical protein
MLPTPFEQSLQVIDLYGILSKQKAGMQPAITLSTKAVTYRLTRSRSNVHHGGRSTRMNSQRLAQLRISPLHIQQGLFASLALLITLLAIQQFQHWTSAQEATQIKQQFTYSQSYSTASAPVVRDTALSLMPVDGKTPVSEMPQRQTWVF